MDPLGILWLGDAAAGPTPGAPRMCQRFVRFGFGVVSRRAVAGKTAKARVERVERVMAKAMRGSPRLSLLTIALVLTLYDGGATLREIAMNRRVKKRDGSDLTQQVSVLLVANRFVPQTNCVSACHRVCGTWCRHTLRKPWTELGSHTAKVSFRRTKTIFSQLSINVFHFHGKTHLVAKVKEYFVRCSTRRFLFDLNCKFLPAPLGYTNRCLMYGMLCTGPTTLRTRRERQKLRLSDSVGSN